MLDLLLFIFAAPVVAAACIIWLVALMHSLAWLAERLNGSLDRRRRIDIHYYHHTAPPEPPHITVIEPPRLPHRSPVARR